MAEINPEIVALVIAVAAGIAESIRQYRKTGRFRLTSLPLRAMKRLIYELRRIFFTHPQKIGKQLPVDRTVEQIRIMIGKQGYEPEWPLSYAYRGEDLNARRYYFKENAKYPHRQIHVRAWDRDEKTTVYAHDEPSPIHHPVAHLQSGNSIDVTRWVVDNMGSIDPDKIG